MGFWGFGVTAFGMAALTSSDSWDNGDSRETLFPAVMMKPG